MHKEILFARLANIGIWLLISFGFLLHLIFIPILSSELPRTYTEFQGDEFIIQTLLSSITLAGQLALLSVSLLVSRIANANLIAETSLKWVNVLAGSSISLAVLFVLLLSWLTNQQATGPVAFALIGGSLVAGVISMVTLSLKYVLRSAIKNEQELEAVI